MRHCFIICFFVFTGTSHAQSAVSFYDQLADSAATLTLDDVRYDAAYYSIDYPYGDVPKEVGVCTDVIIRAYRKLGIDLQQSVHEDMKANFNVYPDMWGLTATDSNIDHRRVPNLMRFFERKGKSLPIDTSALYEPGDIVCWNLGGGIHHIGIVSNTRSNDHRRYLIVHNIGQGQVLEDMLFDFTIIGHYRYQAE